MLCVKPLMMPRFISRTNQWIVITYTIIFILFSSTRSLYTLPQFDFRPYHIGADIKKGMEIPEGAKGPEFETTFILEKNGQRKEFTLENYPDSTWTFIDSKTVQISEGYVRRYTTSSYRPPTEAKTLPTACSAAAATHSC